LTFEYDNDVIVYALEKIISYASKNQYIFVAQSIWWISSIIGLQQGLVIHIDNIRIRSEASKEPALEISQIPSAKEVQVHPDRISQIGQKDYNSEVSNSELNSAEKIIKETKEFINNSKKQRKRFVGNPDPLTRTRSGKVPVKSLTKKQRNRLQAISKDTLSAYIAGRKK